MITGSLKRVHLWPHELGAMHSYIGIQYLSLTVMHTGIYKWEGGGIIGITKGQDMLHMTKFRISTDKWE